MCRVALVAALIAAGAAHAAAAPESPPAPAQATTPGTAGVTAAVIVLAAEGELEALERHRLQAALERALGADRRLQVIDPDRRLADRAGRIPHAVLSEARGLVEVGQALLARDRARAALPRLQAAVEQMSRVLAHVREHELARAQYLQGVAHAALGDERAARSAFETLLTWQPDFVPDTTVAPERVAPLWRAAKDTMRERPAGALDLVTHPAGAEVRVDGRLLGRTPINADGLTVGTHYVSFHLDGYQHALQAVPVYKGMRRALEMPLAPSPADRQVVAHARALLTASTGEDDARRAAAALGELLGVAHAVIVAVPPAETERGRCTAVVHDTATGRRLSAASAPMRADTDALLAELARTLYGQVRLHAQAAAPAVSKRSGAPAGPPVTRRWWRRWWFWTGVAAATAAVVTPILFLQDSGPSCPGGSVCGEVLWRF